MAFPGGELGRGDCMDGAANGSKVPSAESHSRLEGRKFTIESKRMLVHCGDACFYFIF